MNNERYNKLKEEHPDWTDEQIWTKISIEMEADTTINKNEDINPNDPDIVKLILEGAKKWLKEALPQIFARVKEFFEDVIANVKTWIKKGFDYVVELIGRFSRPTVK